MPVQSSLLNYPQSFGSRKINVVKYYGPAAYVAGGEAINAATFGWGSFDRINGGDSVNANNSGNYTVRARLPVGQAGNTALGGFNTCNLVWTAANGTEAANNTNLSGEYINLELIGG